MDRKGVIRWAEKDLRAEKVMHAAIQRRNCITSRWTKDLPVVCFIMKVLKILNKKCIEKSTLFILHCYKYLKHQNLIFGGLFYRQCRLPP
jgi:hypothetical protein